MLIIMSEPALYILSRSVIDDSKSINDTSSRQNDACKWRHNLELHL